VGDIDGVRRARANSTTGNILVEFDERRLDLDGLLAGAQEAATRLVDTTSSGAPRPSLSTTNGDQPAFSARQRAPDPPEAEDQGERDIQAGGEGPSVIRDRTGIMGRARIAVTGLDRDADLGRRLVGALRARPGVGRVSASRLTGRVLIEFDEHQVDIEDLVSHVARMELPDLPGEDEPAHPLDPTPLIQSGARTVGAGLGLGVLAVRRLAGAQGPPSASRGPVAVATAIGVLEGLPPLRRALRQALGRDRAQFAFGAVHVVSLTFAGSPLGLAVSGAGALRLLTETRARRKAWQAYEGRLGDASEALPGETVRLRAGERCPMGGDVIEGSGTMIGRDGLPDELCPGDVVTGGARLSGGPFVVELHADRRFEPQARPMAEPRTNLDRYLAALSPVSLGYAALTAVITRSPVRTLTALLLVNARPALIGADAADSAASARVLRSGVTVVGSRYGRSVRMPGVLLVDGPRALTDRRLEVAKVISLRDDLEGADVLAIAAGVAAASGSPWGPAFPVAGRSPASEGSFASDCASAQVGGSRLSLGPPPEKATLPEVQAQRARGHYVLFLTRQQDGRPLGLIALRPRLAAGARRALGACRERGVRVELIADSDSQASAALADRVELPVAQGSALELIRELQQAGELVALLSDSPHAAAAFDAADLAIGLTSGRSGRFAARADLLVSDLDAVGAIVEAAARRRAAIDDAIVLSVASNVVGGVWGLRSAPLIERGSHATYIAALAAVGLSTVRLWGGRASTAATSRLADPDPERWGRPALPDLLRDLDSRPTGLTRTEAAERVVARPAEVRENPVLAALSDQVRSPLNGALVAGAAVSLALGSVADVALIGAVIAGNAAIGAWQEHSAGRAAALLAREGAASVMALRDGELMSVRSPELVVGDVIALGSGDRVPADARLLTSESLEVDEAALTGESLPVAKAADDPSDAGRVVLEGSDVTVGNATAVIFALGEHTRMGATAAALAMVEPERGALDGRLNRLVRQSLPVVAAGGGLIVASGLAWRRPLATQFALGASIATAVVPEGLPLLAGVAQAAVARRLAGRHALVRRLSAVEALGRVDVACTDKTGTLTAGHLALTAVETFDDDGAEPTADRLAEVLLTAALASPHPDAPDVGAHPTDLAVIRGAQEAGITDRLRVEREAEVPFEPARAFHATSVDATVHLKGAAEALVSRCTRVRRQDGDEPLGEHGARRLLERAEQLAGRGLRVLMVAQGLTGTSLEDPEDLVALGLLGISDPLREGVPAAVARCQEAGVRVIMLTGDHPATARAVAEQAGLDIAPQCLLTGAEISRLDDRELDRRLEDASVIARINPLDKLRIVERLQARGHTVAMTGDGVNDAPALRLAAVGVAMGQQGTEVARQASDVVLADDDFATLVETLVEGRSFWVNLRRSLGLMLGGNLGELGLMVGASVLGLAAPLSTRQILTVNLVTDILPAMAVAVQRPEHRDLSTLRREGGEQDLDRLLRRDVVRRGWGTAAPSLAAYALATRLGSPAQANTVAFASIVVTQLGQTLSLGRSEGTLTRPVLGAIVASGGFVVAASTLPVLAGFLGFAVPGLPGLALVGAATVASVALTRSPAAPCVPALPVSGVRALAPGPPARPAAGITALPAG